MTENTARDLGLRVRKGAVWGAANVALSRLLQFGTTVVVARLIAPEHFGAIAIALAVQMMAVNASELGATAALARGQRDPDAIAPTVYTIGLVTSASLTALMVVTAPWLARTMGDPEATPIIQVLALTVLLAGICSVPTAMIWREFYQGRRMIADLANIVVTTALVIPMALAGWEAMALAWSRVGGQVVATILFLILAPKRYLPGFDRREIGGLLRIGMPLALANIVVFATLNIDYLVIGRELGATQLGLYLLAFSLASLPSGVFTQIVRTVAVPALGRLHAAGTLGRAVPDVVALIAFVTFPVGALLAGLSEPLIEGIYGPVWSGAAAALVGLGIFSAGRVVTELLADLSLAVGRTGMLFWVQVVWLVSLVPIMMFSVRHWGLAGAGFAHAAVVWCIVVPTYLVVIERTTAIPAHRLVGAAAPATICSGLCGVAAWWVATRIEPPLVGVLLAGTVAGLVYLLTVSRWALPVLRRVRSVISAPQESDGQDPRETTATARADGTLS